MSIEVRKYRGDWDLEGWDTNRVSGDDYSSARAARLYDVLGASVEDEEYALAASDDGRWALFGLSVIGHEFAFEAGPVDIVAAAATAAAEEAIDRLENPFDRDVAERGRAALPRALGRPATPGEYATWDAVYRNVVRFGDSSD